VFTMAADYEMLWRGALLHTFLTEQRVSNTSVGSFVTSAFYKLTHVVVLCGMMDCERG